MKVMETYFEWWAKVADHVNLISAAFRQIYVKIYCHYRNMSYKKANFMIMSHWHFHSQVKKQICGGVAKVITAMYQCIILHEVRSQVNTELILLPTARPSKFLFGSSILGMKAFKSP